MRRGVRRLRGARLAGGALIGATLAAASPLAAQTAPPATGPLQPPTREEINRVPRAQPLPPSKLTVTGGIERAPCPLAAPRFQSVTMTLTGVVFDDLQVADPASLQSSYADLIGKTVPIAAVCDIRDAAATLLRRQGFLAAVQVPPQRIQGGVLHLTVLMAKVVAVHVRGNPGHAAALLTRLLGAIETGRVFNQNDAERALLLAGDLPGYTVRLALRSAGTVPGEVIGDVTVDRIPVTAGFNVQNLGSRAVGRFSGLARAEFNDLIGLGDRATIGFSNTFDTSEQSVVQAGYEVRIPGADGLSIAGRFTYAWTKPDIGNGDPLRARTLIASGELGYPLIRRQAETVRLTGGLDVINQRLTFSGLPFTQDRLRVFYARAEYDLRDRGSLTSLGGYSASEPLWRAAGAVEVRKGTGLFGASGTCGGAPAFARCATSPTLSRLDGDPTGGLVRFTGSFELRPRPRFALVVNPQAQYAFDPLLSYEQYSLGNYTVGRGYDPGALVGDSGYGVQIEGRVGSILPSGAAQLAVQPFAFFDVGRVWVRGPLAIDPTPDTLYSTGGGARIAWRNRFGLDLLLAVPLRRAPFQTERDVRFLMSLTTRLLP